MLYRWKSPFWHSTLPNECWLVSRIIDSLWKPLPKWTTYQIHREWDNTWVCQFLVYHMRGPHFIWSWWQHSWTPFTSSICWGCRTWHPWKCCFWKPFSFWLHLSSQSEALRWICLIYSCASQFCCWLTWRKWMRLLSMTNPLLADCNQECSREYNFELDNLQQAIHLWSFEFCNHQGIVFFFFWAGDYRWSILF